MLVIEVVDLLRNGKKGEKRRRKALLGIALSILLDQWPAGFLGLLIQGSGTAILRRAGGNFAEQREVV